METTEYVYKKWKKEEEIMKKEIEEIEKYIRDLKRSIRIDNIVICFLTLLVISALSFFIYTEVNNSI